MTIVCLDKARRSIRQRWRALGSVGYTARLLNISELAPAMSATKSQLDELEPVGLVGRIRAGDQQAETQLVKKFQRPVYELLRNRSRDPELAQDLLQETFIVVLGRLRSEGIEQPDKLPAFMHRVAHNLLIGHFRKESRRDTRPDSDAIEKEVDSGDAQLESVLRDEQGQLVRSLLDELHTPRDREILLRFYVWGHEKPLVCEALGLNYDQFDRVISRARKRFRNLAERSLGDI